MNIGTLSLREQKHWRGTHRGVPFKVMLWGFADNSLDKWNYYLYLLERNCVNFESLWLPAETYQILPTTPKRVTYNYYPAFGAVEMHGGITYYEKHGELTERSIEIGCDFAHLDDEFAGWDLYSVVADMESAIDSLYKKGYLKPLEITEQKVE